MTYHYGHKDTAFNGVYIWLQGFRNKEQYGEEIDNLNYIPRNLDDNQKSNLIRDILLGFLRSKQIHCSKKEYNKYWRTKHKYAQIIQANFKDFVEYMKLNYKNGYSNNE